MGVLRAPALIFCFYKVSSMQLTIHVVDTGNDVVLIDLDKKSPENPWKGIKEISVVTKADSGEPDDISIIEKQGRLVELRFLVARSEDITTLSASVFNFIMISLNKAKTDDKGLKGAHVFFGSLEVEDGSTVGQKIGVMLWK